MSHSCPICFILPPHIESKLAENPKFRERALRSMQISERQRGIRQAAALLPLVGQAGTKHRTIFDDQQTTNLPGTKVRDEGAGPTNDIAVNEAYDYSGDTYDFYSQVFNRNSVDDHGLTIKSTVHYDTKYDNAFWNGQQMIYGDGDGELFERFTISIDVIGHELTHGVTQNEAQLTYQDQPGALNESMSEVFGSLIKQWVKNQTADQADWLIGQGLLTPAVQGVALRSMKAPGTAYDDPNLGKDPQPADYEALCENHQRQRRSTHQFGYPEQSLLSCGHQHWRLRLAEGRPDLVSHTGWKSQPDVGFPGLRQCYCHCGHFTFWG